MIRATKLWCIECAPGKGRSSACSWIATNAASRTSSAQPCATRPKTADLSQETFLRAYAHLGTFNPQLGKFSTWIYQIARNVIRTYLAKSLRAPQLQELPQEQSLESALPDPLAARRSGRRRAARRSRARAARRACGASGAHAHGLGAALFRQHGVSDDREHAGALARQREDADPSRQNRAHQEDARARSGAPSKRCRRRREGEAPMRCSSCEPLLDAYLEATLRAARRARRSRRICAPATRCEALLRELRVIDALLETARPPGSVAGDFTAPSFRRRTSYAARSSPARPVRCRAAALCTRRRVALAASSALRSARLAAPARTRVVAIGQRAISPRSARRRARSRRRRRWPRRP